METIDRLFGNAADAEGRRKRGGFPRTIDRAVLRTCRRPTPSVARGAERLWIGGAAGAD